MSGNRLGISLLVVGAILTTSCGMVSDARAGSAETAAVPDQHSRSLTEPVLPDPDHEGTTSTTPPPTSTTPPPDEQPLSPSALTPEDLAAIDRCARVVNFQAAGYALYERSIGQAEVPVDTIGALLDATHGLVPVVSPAGDEALKSVLGIMEPEARRLMSGPDATVAELQVLLDRVVPQLTDLLRALTQSCPTAIGEAGADQAEQVKLGSGSL